MFYLLCLLLFFSAAYLLKSMRVIAPPSTEVFELNFDTYKGADVLDQDDDTDDDDD